MSPRYRWPVLVAATVMYAAITNAGIAQAPGDRDELAQIIRQAGYDCPQVERIEVAEMPAPGWETFRPEVAICKNGKRFLVAKSGRRGGNTIPVVRPLPIEKKY